MNILELTFAEFAEAVKQRHGKSLCQAAAAYREVFKKGSTPVSGTGASAGLEKSVHAPGKSLKLNPNPVVEEKKEAGLTKFITRLHDGFMIESVIVPMTRHATLCISSQAGCARGCAFCETGRRGLLRNLTVGEIVGQVYTARFVLGQTIKNVVFMGMGEPCDNLDRVIQAVRVLSDQHGFDIAHSHITVSTCGVVEGIQKLAALRWPRLNLAISINAPNDRLRSALMPVNSGAPLAMLKETLRAYPLRKAGVFFIQYVLIKNINNHRTHAKELAGFLRLLPVRVNIIPYNPLPGVPFERPEEKDIQQFHAWLAEEKIFVRTRLSKGRQVMAGCGQLGSCYNVL